MRQRLRVQLLVEGVTWGIGIAIVLTAVSIAIDRTMRPDTTVRTILLVVSGLTLAYFAFQHLQAPLTIKLDDLDLAELLERRQQGLGQRLTTVLQLPRLLEQDPSASPSMIQAAVRDDFEALQTIDLHATFDSDRRRNVWVLLVTLVSLTLAFWALNPSIVNLWARRWFAGVNIRWPQKTYLSITGLGDADRLRVPGGEAVTIQVETSADFSSVDGGWKLTGRGEPLFIEIPTRPTSDQPDSVSIRIELADGSQRVGNFTRFSAGQFRYELPPLSKPAEITITGGDDWFGPVKVEPIQRPGVDSLTIVAHTPGKSEQDTFRADDAERQLLFLPTTQLELTLKATQPLASARATVSGTDKRIELDRIDDETYLMKWETKEAVTFEYELTSQSGGLASKPYFLTIGILNDRPPRLTLRSSGVGRRITPVARIPLNIRAMDDFGVAKLALELELAKSVEQKIETTNHAPVEENFAESGQKLSGDIERDTTLELAEFKLVPGAGVRIRSTASDACVLGTQSAESRWLSFQVVSADELFYDILTRQREQRAKLVKALEVSKGQLDSLRKLNSTAEANAIVRVHQGVARQVWQVAGQLNASLQEMTLNDLGNPTARQLLEKGIIKPLFEMHTTTMTEIRTKLEALAADSSLSEEHREAATTAQTQGVEQLQRILDQMSQWESFVDVVNQLRQIITSEEQIRETTEKSQKEQIKGVFDDE